MVHAPTLVALVWLLTAVPSASEPAASEAEPLALAFAGEDEACAAGAEGECGMSLRQLRGELQTVEVQDEDEHGIPGPAPAPAPLTKKQKKEQHNKAKHQRKLKKEDAKHAKKDKAWQTKHQ
mmetsp:Transcript_87454/g.280551  ORF Transcript_87454/g.280551 Transcript_87454/m.280551 type:complete len:122 (+) Transcript_87454:134-499(+)